MNTSSGDNYNITLSYYAVENIFDIDQLDCMFQQVLAIHLGWADQITPKIVEDVDNIYTWERMED